ncbi:hypothetical protein [Paenibacillus sp. UNC451MF]|uniref:hypothetical protein n=1 Tax=Paenibacillus sp. UNC451MF TaxID=1449063 RepID=UPI00048D2B0E|nr:hypothetical protein [Paenibacillus sp. UNC451MF]
MVNKITTETVKRLFDIQDWMELATKTKVKQYLASYPFLEKKINEEIISNIPAFTATFKEIISELNERRKAKNKKSVDIIDSLNRLQTALSKEVLTLEERKSVIEQINHITNKIEESEKKKEDRKRKIIKGVTIAGTALGLMATQLIKGSKHK